MICILSEFVAFLVDFELSNSAFSPFCFFASFDYRNPGCLGLLLHDQAVVTTLVIVVACFRVALLGSHDHFWRHHWLLYREWFCGCNNFVPVTNFLVAINLLLTDFWVVTNFVPTTNFVVRTSLFSQPILWQQRFCSRELFCGRKGFARWPVLWLL